MKKNKRNRIYFPLLFACLLLFLAVNIQQCRVPREAEKAPEASFYDNYYPAPLVGEEIISHSVIRISYNEKHEQANWVAYKLLSSHIGGPEKRQNKFLSDPKVTSFSAHSDDYKKSGFDRGHLAPAGDFTWSQQAMAESFYMSNISPQQPGFNRGIWKKLEEQARRWALENEELIIVTAGVLKEGLPQIGNRNRVSVPAYYYKILLDIKEPEIKAIAFLMENKASNSPLMSFAISIDSLEAFTGIDFFPALEDNLENQLESTVELQKWFR
jgi:endonuclease G, mitochondrial